MSTRSISIDLEFPVVLDGKEFKTITVRRPKGRDMRHLPGDDAKVEDFYPFFAMLMSAGGTDLTEEFIEEMDAADITAMSEKVMAFLERKGKRRPAARATAR